MANHDLHIVTFSVPFPAHYGGAIDVWNRMLALHNLGVRIQLHCFVYGPYMPQARIKEVVQEVHYYPRRRWTALVKQGLPYVVSSRRCPALLGNLQKDRMPILFEGIHSTGYVDQTLDRKRLLRAHNIEYQYYKELAVQEKGLRSLMFYREAYLLEQYERKIAGAFDAVFPISPGDHQWYVKQNAHCTLISPFHGHHQVDVQEGRGEYILYHGDLSLPINQLAVMDMMQQLGRENTWPVVVAGRSGDYVFEQKLKGFANLQRKADVSDDDMIELIQNAQVIVIHTLHGSGMKLKLFPSLYHGRFVLATFQAQTETILDEGIHFYSPSSLSDIVSHFWPLDFDATHLENRRRILSRYPDDQEKAKEIIRYL